MAGALVVGTVASDGTMVGMNVVTVVTVAVAVVDLSRGTDGAATRPFAARVVLGVDVDPDLDPGMALHDPVTTTVATTAHPKTLRGDDEVRGTVRLRSPDGQLTT